MSGIQITAQFSAVSKQTFSYIIYEHVIETHGAYTLFWMHDYLRTVYYSKYISLLLKILCFQR